MIAGTSANLSEVADAPTNRSPSPAVLRMMRSRIALKQVLQSDDTSNAAPEKSGGILANLKSLQGNPSAQLLLGAVNQMWAKHPWRVLIVSALQAGDVMLKPVAMRSPIALIAGAVAVGAVLSLVRPWRLLKKSALLSALLGR